MASSDSQIDKPQHGYPKRAELPDVNINTGAKALTVRAPLSPPHLVLLHSLQRLYRILNFLLPFLSFSFPLLYMYVNKFWLFSLLSSVCKGVTTAQQQKRELYYKLDTILITALQNEFEIWPGHTVDRQDMVEYLRSVVLEHIADCPELEKILNLRDTVLTGRVKRAFPGVEYKRKQMRQDHYRKAYLFCGIAWGGVVHSGNP